MNKDKGQVKDDLFYILFALAGLFAGFGIILGLWVWGVM